MIYLLAMDHWDMRDTTCYLGQLTTLTDNCIIGQRIAIVYLDRSTWRCTELIGLARLVNFDYVKMIYNATMSLKSKVEVEHVYQDGLVLLTRPALVI